MTPLNSQQNTVRRWVLTCWALLLALVCLRQLQSGFNPSSLGWALLFSVPLLVSVPGLSRGNRYTYKWSSLCVLPYFIVGVTESVANAALRYWALLMLGASLLWFFAMLAFLRVTPVDHLAE